ncbi:DUF4177 domain-containing protein [Lacihabitans sp. LS3-19]|uniref:DUF4177 domain-containing protein n=1 Tax=Lacihabitans sp. LS3-19 TaxID=2487335 RepID=UPI0020CF3DF0|nr:DUF4177 domain-containing protein [Lacihabitans sp. LS3-19]MCP9770179.1 DUF4177 domain-containing protein [Lacihabitans sp. LS3-19]
MKKYEYKVLKTKQEGFWNPEIKSEELMQKLNALGAEGWEMVSAVDTNKHQGITNEVVLFFKRESVF